MVPSAGVNLQLALFPRRNGSQSIVALVGKKNVWFAVLGFKDRENVLSWLEKAYDESSSWLAWVKVEPRFDWLRGDPGFDSIVRRLGL